MPTNDQPQKNLSASPVQQTSRSHKRFERELLIMFVEEGLRTGSLDQRIAEPEFLKRYLLRIAQRLKTDKFLAATDHRETLLEESKRYVRRRKQELALLLFATWTEHFLNNLIEGQARRMSIPQDQIADILRSTPIKAKVTWLLRLVGLPTMTAAKAKAIVAIMEARNGFVHYKWKMADIDNSSWRGVLIPNLSYKIRSISHYLKRYESKHVLRYSKREIIRFLQRSREATQ